MKQECCSRIQMNKRLIIRMSVAFSLCLLAGCATTNKALFSSEKYRQRADEAKTYSHYLASIIYQDYGDLENAAEELKHALEQNNESTDIYLRLAGVYLQLDDYEKAIRFQDKSYSHSRNSGFSSCWYFRRYSWP